MAKKIKHEVTTYDPALYDNRRLDNVVVQEGIDVMRENMATYGFYQNEQRAIINDTDGLKPVHRRLLYTFYHLGLTSSSKFTKCAEVTGTNMGLFHPHGDAYGSMVRLVQPDALNIPLIVGQGNFGGLDTVAAASRYTEAKISKFAEEVLFEELKYRAVPIGKNYSGTVDEPEYFPAKLPLGLINSNMGIGYGLASNVPGFNINEVIAAMIALIKNPDEKVTDYIKGPDFPSYGQIISPDKDLINQIETGRGSIRLRGKIDISQETNELVISELPYNISAQDIKQKILDLIEMDKKSKISEVIDLSAHGNINIRVLYKKGTTLEKERNLLFKKTQLETSIPFNFIILKDNEKPKLFNVKEYILSFIGFRKHCVTVKFNIQIDNLNKRLHILEGLLKLQDKKILDDIIDSIRNSENLEELKVHMQEKYGFSVEQIDHIFNLRLAALSKISIKELQDEFDAKTSERNTKVDIVTNHLEEEIIREWLELKDKYGQERKTFIREENALNDSLENFTEDKPISIILTEKGYIKSLDRGTFRTQKRGGKGVMGLKLSEDDEVKISIDCMYHDSVYFITNKGKIYSGRGWTIPEASRVSKGTPVQNFLDFKEEGETVDFMFTVNKEEKENIQLVILYKNGLGYKVKGELALNKRNGSRFAAEDATLANVFKVYPENKYLVMGKKSGLGVRIRLEDIPERQSIGGVGVKLAGLDKAKDSVVASLLAEDEEKILTISGNGFGKLSDVEEYRLTNRGGKGVKVGIRSGDTLVSMHSVDLDTEQLLKLVTEKGQTIVIDPSTIREASRNAKGVKLVNLEKDQVKLTSLVEKGDEIEEIKVETPSVS